MRWELSTKGTDPLIGRTVAVKIIRLETVGQARDSAFLREQLLREARSAGRLSHPGIVTIYDVGEENDIAFVAMERVNGPSLQQAIASGQYAMGWNNALNILRQSAMALDHAHQRGVIHRDIKPTNIMLHEGFARPRSTDFGIVKFVSASSEHSGTRGTMGTPSYMSPEQIQGGTLDGKSDQFSLAVVAFRLLTRTEPFEADSVAASSSTQSLYEPRPSCRALNPRCSPPQL